MEDGRPLPKKSRKVYASLADSARDHIYARSPLKDIEQSEQTLTVSALVAEIDEEKDSTIDYAGIRADPISEIRH